MSSANDKEVGELPTGVNQINLDSNTTTADEAQSSAEQQAANDSTNTEVVDFNRILNCKMPFDVLSTLYAITVASGGIIGYAKAGSIPSLAAGLTFGSILGVGAYMTSVNPNNYTLTLATSTALAGLMGYRFINSRKFMPAGLVATLSIAMILRFTVVRYLLANNKVSKG